MHDFKDRRVLISGGNSGIGRGIAHRFARAGASLVLLARDPVKGERVVAELSELGASAVFHAIDLSDDAAVAALFRRLSGEYERLDVVINNAGLGARRSGVNSSDGPGERWTKLRGANLDAAYNVSSFALPMLARAIAGSMVNISSTATWHGNWGTYCIAKAGVEGLTRAFAAEGARFGVRVNGVSPGWIATEQDAETSASGGDEWALPPSLFNRMGSTDEIAAAVCFLASPEASFITGQTLIVDGGLMITDYPSAAMLEQVGDRLRSR